MIGEEHRDHRDGEQVVDDGEGQQKGAQRRRQMGGQHRKHRERERDVGGDRHRPAVEVLGMAGGQIDRDVDRRGDDHSPDGGRDRQRGARGVAQVAGDELALELQPDDEEEDRQQPVGGPRRHAQVQMQRFGADRELRDRL